MPHTALNTMPPVHLERADGWFNLFTVMPEHDYFMDRLDSLTTGAIAETHYTLPLVHFPKQDMFCISEGGVLVLNNLDWPPLFLNQLVEDSKRIPPSALHSEHGIELQDGSLIRYLIFPTNTQANVILVMQTSPPARSFEYFQASLRRHECPFIAFVKEEAVLFGSDSKTIPASFPVEHHHTARLRAKELIEWTRHLSPDAKPDFAIPGNDFPYYRAIIPLGVDTYSCIMIPVKTIQYGDVFPLLVTLQKYYQALLNSIGSTDVLFVRSTALALKALFMELQQYPEHTFNNPKINQLH